MRQKRSYKRYPKELKEETVALVRDQGYSVPEAAKSRCGQQPIVSLVKSA